MTAAELVDGALAEPVLVFGSPPPEGRDLDLLARPAAHRAVEARLAQEGFLHRDGEWVSFAGGAARAVDLVPVADWNLPERELEDLFAAALPIPGFTHLVAPAPEHQLLILATRVQAGASLSAKRRRRAEAALAADPAAWRRAAEREPAWGDGLARLAATLQDRRPDSRPLASARLRAWRLRHRRVIALSGVDGSGKSSQARALAELLAALGHEAEVVWTPLASDAWIARLARPVKRLLGVLPALRGRQEPAADAGGIVPNPGSRLRERSRAVNASWAMLVAVANAWAHARLTLRVAGAGRVVVFDRYVLDSLVRLRFLYGDASRFRLQRAIVRRLSPAPALAVFLDVPAEVSLARKDDRWSPAELARQVQLYREEHQHLDVVRLDGTRAHDELREELAELVWRRLG